MNVEVNYVAVLLAAISAMVLGSIWYAKPVLGTAWIKLVKLDEKRAKKDAPLALSVGFIVSLLMAYILAHVTYISQEFYKVSYLESGLNTAFFLWLGIAVPTILMHGLFEQRRKKLILMTVAHEFVGMMLMGLIIGLLY